MRLSWLTLPMLLQTTSAISQSYGIIRAPFAPLAFSTSQSTAPPQTRPSLKPSIITAQPHSSVSKLIRVSTPSMGGMPPSGFEWGEGGPPGGKAGLLELFDNLILKRILRIVDHAPSLASLSYFGLISMTMMMPMRLGPIATFRAVITRAVGPTSNQAFAQYFSTLVTPASFVFLIWPVIAVLQLLTVTASALRSGPALKQSNLSALTLSNAFAVFWLLVSSNSLPGALPLGSFLALPAIPLLAGAPLRSLARPRGFDALVFQVFSSFTTLASCLAFAVELQHGGRIPFFTGRAEPSALVFLGLVAALIRLPESSIPRRAVTTFALSGILVKRLAASTASALGLALSPSFLATAACWLWSSKKLIEAVRKSLS